MMDLIQRFFSKDITNKSALRNNFTNHFYSMPEHSWISEAGCSRHFDQLFSHLPSGIIEALMTKYPVAFIPSDKLQCNVLKNPALQLVNSIVIFPEFQKLLLSDKKSAVAYLAHELAFVLYELEHQKSEPFMAEIEADKFVCDLGLTFELEELLLMLDETLEKRLRLTYLTINHFKDL